MSGESVVYRGFTWTIENTGGGCTAYTRTDTDGTYWMLTMTDDPSHPDVGDPATIGHYPNEDAQIEDVLSQEHIAEWFPDGFDVEAWREDMANEPELPDDPYDMRSKKGYKEL